MHHQQTYPLTFCFFICFGSSLIRAFVLSLFCVCNIIKLNVFSSRIVDSVEEILKGLRCYFNELGMAMGRGSYPPPLPCYSCLIPHPHLASFSGELSSTRPRPTRYPPRPNMNFHFFFFWFHSFWLNYMKQKNFH